MNDTVKLTLTPAPKGERYDFGNGFSLPVAAHAVNNEENINIPVFNTMTDYKWQLRVFESRLKHPDSYATFEDVEEVKQELIQWLTDNEPEPQESYLKERFNNLIAELAITKYIRRKSQISETAQ